MNHLIRVPRLHSLYFRDQAVRFFIAKGGEDGSRSAGTGVTASSGQQNTNDSRNLDEPYKYFGSQAEKFRSTPQAPPHPEYSPYIISLSLSVFMAYFCIFRDENDIDELLGRDLFDHFGDEASRLKKAYDYNIKHNLPTHEIISRLREIGAPVPPGMR